MSREDLHPAFWFPFLSAILPGWNAKEARDEWQKVFNADYSHCWFNPFGSKCRSYRSCWSPFLISWQVYGYLLDIYRFIGLVIGDGSLNNTATLQNKHKLHTTKIFTCARERFLISEVGWRFYSKKSNRQMFFGGSESHKNKQTREQRRRLFVFYCKQ